MGDCLPLYRALMFDIEEYILTVKRAHSPLGILNHFQECFHAIYVHRGITSNVQRSVHMASFDVHFIPMSLGS